jgi:hypothetical protein
MALLDGERKENRSGVEDRLHPAHFTIHQHDFNPVGMGGAAGQKARYNAFGQLAAHLVLFLDYLDAHPWLDSAAFG